MGAAICTAASYPLFPSHPFPTHHSGTRGRMNMPSSMKVQRQTQVRAQAFADSLVVAVSDQQTSSVGGNVSVLLPVSAVLLLFYWVTNFVVPGYISRELGEREGSNREKTGEE